VLARQEAVRDLVGRIALREDLATAGVDVRAEVDPRALVAWALGPRVLQGGWRRVAAPLLALCAALALAWGFYTGDWALLLPVLLVNGVFGVGIQERVGAVLHGAADPVRELATLATVLARVQREPFGAARTIALRQMLEEKGGEALRAIRQLRWIIEIHDWQHNIVFAPIGALLLLGMQCAFAVEAWRERHGPAVETWLRIVGELEAFASLAAYAYEHPADPFPEIVPPGGTPCYEAVQLAHPLIPRARAVANDVRLGDLPGMPQALIVSGSNMSGKSTLLRSVGINAVLALTGAPVRATALRLSPIVMGATLRVQDSLQAGRSRFYAEITRVRELVDRARESHALLFLLDELFHGTNSHDRVAGAQGVLRSLLDLQAIGLITTHDLALAAIADDLAPRVLNVHFDDTLSAGEIEFDYQLKPGPVTRSNALALMKAVGLNVEG